MTLIRGSFCCSARFRCGVFFDQEGQQELCQEKRGTACASLTLINIWNEQPGSCDGETEWSPVRQLRLSRRNPFADYAESLFCNGVLGPRHWNMLLACDVAHDMQHVA